LGIENNGVAMKKNELGVLIAILVLLFTNTKAMGADAQISEEGDAQIVEGADAQISEEGDAQIVEGADAQISEEGDTQISKTAEYSSLPIEIVTSFLNALDNNNYEKAWEYLTQFTKDSFGNIENFQEEAEKWYSENTQTQSIELGEVISFSKKRLFVTLNSIHEFRGFLLIEEGQNWRIAISKGYLQKIRKDLDLLSAAVINYYERESVLPDKLSQLVSPHTYIKAVPFDPYSDGKEPYHYVINADRWEIYSVGPDGKDDFGIKKYNLSGGVYDGDIVEEGMLN
jgi:hypothetical protein